MIFLTQRHRVNKEKVAGRLLFLWKPSIQMRHSTLLLIEEYFLRKE
ncbi:hypothetical protein B4168_4021 [Anoxybacillus flavithermus]|nr:hypothetical protein B4168_4021 [Anoxybacillus flavithermus]OAO87600.1 hypothetical protein GT23_1249 [Parageobacillus thermoglucosidasius]